MKQRYYDLSHHGLYLYDFYINCENFGLPFFVSQDKQPSETLARALFILDKNLIIDENKHSAMFFRIWRSRIGVVYLVKTNIPGYERGIVNALDIINFLELNGNITSNIFERDEMNEAFLKALEFDKKRFFQHLFKSKYLGVNRNGEKVLASYFGRFIFNNTNPTTESTDLLYKSRRYYYREIDVLKQYAINHDMDFERLAGMLVSNQNTPSRLADETIDLCSIIIQSHYYNEVSDTDKTNLIAMQTYVQACLLFELLPSSSFLSRKTFRSAFVQCREFEKTRKLTVFSHLGMPTIPMTMCVLLLGLLGTNKKIAAAQINMPLLAIIQSGEVVVLGQHEPIKEFTDRYQQEVTLVSDQASLNCQKNPNQLSIFTQTYKIQQHTVSLDFDGKSIFSYTFTNDAHARLLKLLEARPASAKSVFLIPCFTFGICGYQDETELVRWLSSNYLNVEVIDIDKSLFYHDKSPQNWRLLTIGHRRSPETVNQYEYSQLTKEINSHSKTIQITTYTDFYRHVVSKILNHEQAIATAKDTPIQSKPAAEKPTAASATTSNLVAQQQSVDLTKDKPTSAVTSTQQDTAVTLEPDNDSIIPSEHDNAVSAEQEASDKADNNSQTDTASVTEDLESASSPTDASDDDENTSESNQVKPCIAPYPEPDESDFNF